MRLKRMIIASIFLAFIFLASTANVHAAPVMWGNGTKTRPAWESYGII